MRGLSHLLIKEVAHGRWGISRDCCDDGVMASFLSTATFSCVDIEHTDDTAKALVLENVEVPLFKYCAAELRPLVGARRSTATGQAGDLPGKIGACG